MSSETTAETSQPIFQLQTIYLKDLSLEQPNSPAIFLEQKMPDLQITVNVGVEALAETTYETTVTVTLTAKVGDKTAYLIEAKQAGIFEVRNLPKETLDQVLYITCASIVYPYLRANVADIVLRSGFPPVHLVEINFEAYFRERVQQEQATQQVAANGSETPVQ
ncbi:protein-export chaperone SecB [Oxalobacter vibrioformis]|uniref:Protein-export protein SecB n=1 Tax=Oxalobacter vibrioformis TaxID=933080 RepID=A0A9E9LZ45_9BURK|nr:protein-export chaperone SecB [Oxalobacter vibrioformis]WAW11156.1 protein-export chaperone SecB [Oxalobacter vibrioformis]